ncbi:MAG: tetratricopeptide repeat protein [Chloroflexi bacterium]|nr:tetratricopeptide repeat protein [Chloroflexota bacterium]
MPANLEDRFGMPLSTSSAGAAECYREGIDRLLSQNHGPDLKLQEAIDLDEGFAVAHGALAFWYQQRARPEEARETIKQALALASGVTRRERQQIQAVNLWITGKGRESIALIKEHLAEFHRDGLLLRLAHRLYMLGCSGAGSPDFPPEYLALLQGVESHCMDDWAFLAEYAFAHHETGQLDAAMDLAQRSLDMNPINAVASHSMTHVHFERGDAASGEDFLGAWLQSFDAPASSYVHLSWHLALFELAQGKYQETLDRYENFIRPSVVAKSMATLNDSASLMWRLQLYGGTPPPKPWEEVLTIASPAAERPGAAFRDAHAALAFAGAGDHEAMAKMTERLRKSAEDGDSFTKEVVLPLAEGIEAFGQGRYAESVEFFEPVFPQLVRIGGSHAQREVFEDTMLEAYIRAGRFEKAEQMLRARLGQRDSVRDTFWLGRVQSAQGQTFEADASFGRAIKGWEGCDPDAPELTALNNLKAASD